MHACLTAIAAALLITGCTTPVLSPPPVATASPAGAIAQAAPARATDAIAPSTISIGAVVVLSLLALAAVIVVAYGVRLVSKIVTQGIPPARPPNGGS